MRTCIIYTRFSPRPDASTSESIDNQVMICTDYAKRRGWEVREIFRDPDVSGADEYRPELWRTINSLKKGEVLLVWRRDRLARNLYLAEQINRAVDKAGGTITAVSGDIEGDGPEQRLIRQVVAAMAEYERKLISMRTSDVLRARMRNHVKAGGMLPYGWQRADDDKMKLAVNPVEMAVVREICERFDQGETMNSIAVSLDPALSRNGKWHTETVRRIIARRSYLPPE